MDLDQGETITTDHDSDEADESFYLSRLMLTGEKRLSSPNLFSSGDLNDVISPQIGLLCCRVQNKNAPATKQTHGTMVFPASPIRVQDVLNEQENSTQREQSEVYEPMESQIHIEADITVARMSEQQRDVLISTVKPQLHVTSKPQSSTFNSSQNPSQNTLPKDESLLDKFHLQPGPPLRHSVKKSVKTGKQKTDPEVTMEKKDKTPRRSPRSQVRNETQDTKECNKVFDSPLTACVKPKLQAKAFVSPGFRGTGIVNPKTGKVLTLNAIHRRNRFGETKVHAAVVQGDIQAVKDMIKLGASVNMADYAGWTPLHEAVDRNNHKITEILLKAGARVNCRGYNGIIPLHDAIQQHYYEIVDLLLKYGADPLLKCDGGKTPMDMTTDSSMYRLVEKYLPKAKRHPFEYPPNTTDSAAVIGTKAAQNSKGTADASEHESSQQPIETEPISGPSVGKPSCDPSKKFEAYFKAELSPQSSTNALCPVRDQGRDFCSQVPLLVQDLENQGSDSCLASDVESDVTVDYTEANSSSPEHWTLCATQDFSGAAGETLMNDANSVAEESSSNSFSDYPKSLIIEKGKPCQSSSGDSCQICCVKATAAGKRLLEGCQDHNGADIKDDKDSATAKKKIKRTKLNTQTENEFLEYLINFDQNHVITDLDDPSIQLDKDKSKQSLAVYQKFPSETLHISDTHNDMGHGCNISLLSPRLNELVDSYLQEEFKGDMMLHLSEVMSESPLQREDLFQATDSNNVDSPSLLVGIIHNNGLTCSSESSEVDEPEELDTAKKEMTVTFTAHSLYHEDQQLQGALPPPCFSIESIPVENISGQSETHINAHNSRNDSTHGNFQEVISPNTKSILKPLNQNKNSNKNKQNQQGVSEIPCSTTPTQVSGSCIENQSMEYKNLVGDILISKLSEIIIDGPEEQNSPCKGTVSEPANDFLEDHPIDINDPNTSAVSPTFSCAKVDIEHLKYFTRADCVDEDDASKASDDSDCTFVEQLCQSEATDIQDVVNTTVQNKVFSSEERYSEKRAENTASTQITSVSVLRQLSPKHLCALSSLYITEDTASFKHDGPHIALEDKELSHKGKLKRQKKKTKHRKLRKRQTRLNLSKGINEPDTLNKVSKKVFKFPHTLHKRNGLGETHLHRACMRGDLQLVKSLIEAGIDVNISDNAGWTALHEASSRGFVDVVEQLLKAGADVTSRGLGGLTPLHDAVSTGSYEIVRLLLQFGSSPYDKNMLGKSAVDLTAHESIKELLLTFKGPFRKPGQTTDNSKQGSQLLAVEHSQPDTTKRPECDSDCRSKCFSSCEKSTLGTQSELKKNVMMSRDPLLIQNQSSLHQYHLDNISYPLFVELDVPQYCEVISDRTGILNDYTYNSENAPHSETQPTEPVVLRPCELSLTDQCLPQSSETGIDFGGKQKLICLIKDGIIQNGDNNLEITLKGSNHKASLLLNGSIRDDNGRVFLLPEHWVESVLGNNIPVTSYFAWKKMIYQSKSLWDYAVSAYSNTEKTSSLQPLQCHTFNVCTAGPAPKETSRNEGFMNLKTILLISDEEFCPSHVMDRYWDFFTQSEEWTFETVPV